MMARPGARGGGGALGLILLLYRLAAGAEPMPAEVRVRSTPPPLPTTTITVRAAPDSRVVDRTVGARPTAGRQGPASTGDTFSDEIRLFLPAVATSRPAAVEVSDDLVSMVRVLPEGPGTTLVIFVRQPVVYTVNRPTALGELVIALKGRPVPPKGRQQATAPGPGGQDQVAIDAEELHYDQDNDVMVARGSVSITRGALTLRADEVRYDRRSGIAEATGNVVLTDPESTIEGSAARIDLNDESGWMENVAADFARSGYSLVCDRLEKGIGPRYRIDEGNFSTCRCGGLEKPSWSVGGKRTDVELNGIGVVRGATMRVKDVPVLWVPVLAFPALTDRASGFLMPRFGYSSRRGFQYEQPFFWNISKSQDATVALDVETEARIGVLGEYRYSLARRAHGAFAGGYWNESFRSPSADEVRSSQTPPTEAPVNRWLTLGRAIQPLGEGRQLYLDAFAVSDNTLLKEITNFSSTLDTGLRLGSTRLTKTRAGFLQTWDRGLAQAEGVYFQDLIDPQEFAVQRAPALRAEHALPLLGNRIVGRLAGQATNFQRVEAYDGFRGDVSPELFLPFNLGRALAGSVTGRVHGTYYRLADDEQLALVVPNETFVAQQFRLPRGRTGMPELPALDKTHFRGVPEVRAQLGSEVSRVYDFPYFGLQKLRHSIEPTVNYLYVPRTDQELGRATLPDCNRGPFENPNFGVFCNATIFSRGYQFDELDAINRRSFFSYGFTTRLLGRFGGAADPVPPAPESDDDDWSGAGGGDEDEPPSPAAQATRAAPTRELLRLAVRHGFDVLRDDVNRNSHLANLDLGLRLTPLSWTALTYEASVNVAGGALAAQSFRIQLREPGWLPSARNVFQSPSMVSLSYRFIEENVNVRSNQLAERNLFANLGTQSLIGGLYLRLGQYAGVSFGALYDLNGGQLVTENGRTRELGPHFILRDYLFRIISPCNCWAAEIGMSDNFTTDERLFRFQLTLLGLGSFGQSSPTTSYYGVTALPSLGLRPPAALGPSAASYF